MQRRLTFKAISWTREQPDQQEIRGLAALPSISTLTGSRPVQECTYQPIWLTSIDLTVQANHRTFFPLFEQAQLLSSEEALVQKNSLMGIAFDKEQPDSPPCLADRH